MNILNKSISKAKERPVKVLQFGEGNFLRGFVDYMIDVANEKEVFDGSVVVVKPIAFGNLAMFHEQECQYTLSLRGKEEGQTKVSNRIITCISESTSAGISCWWVRMNPANPPFCGASILCWASRPPTCMPRSLRRIFASRNCRSPLPSSWRTTACTLACASRPRLMPMARPCTSRAQWETMDTS